MEITALDWTFLTFMTLFFAFLFGVNYFLAQGLETEHADPGENVDWTARARRQQRREEVGLDLAALLLYTTVYDTLLACCQDLAIDMELRRRNSFGEQQEEEGAPDTSLPLMDENPLSLTVGNGGLVSGT